MREQNMGDTETFKDFVKWGKENYPAKHYLVILWNHGSGWSKNQIAETKSISYDDTDRSYITTNQLSWAMKELTAHSGEKIDVLSFDACLMAMYEVADSLSTSADYMVASEDVEPGDGYPYNNILRSFYRSFDKSPEALSRIIVKEYGRSYTNGSQGEMSVTHSALNLLYMEELKFHIDQWVNAIDNSNVHTDDLKYWAKIAQNYYVEHYKDLGDYVSIVHTRLKAKNENEEIIGAQGVINASDRLLQTIEYAIVENFTSRVFENSTGLAIYLPVNWRDTITWNTGSSRDRRPKYLKLNFAQTTLWDEYLDFLFP
jgi:hypothetical protein